MRPFLTRLCAAVIATLKLVLVMAYSINVADGALDCAMYAPTNTFVEVRLHLQFAPLTGILRYFFTIKIAASQIMVFIEKCMQECRGTPIPS